MELRRKLDGGKWPTMGDRNAHPVRRALEWWLGPSGRRIFVWLVWAGLTATAGGYIWEYGPNLPVHDEWEFVPVLFDTPAKQLRWVIERHGEHRYPLARLLDLALFHSSGGDFRAAMWGVLVLQAGAAAVFIRTAGRVRGRSAYSDCWFPILLLHRGHAENLIMGYQVAFLLTVFALALFVGLATSGTHRTDARTGWLGAALLLALACGGGIGLLFVPFVGGWLLWRLTGGRTCPTAPSTIGAIVYNLFVLGIAAIGMLDAATAPSVDKPEQSSTTVWTVFQTTANAFGSGLTSPHSEFGILLVVAWTIATGWLVQRAIVERSERPRLLGYLAVIGGVATFVAVVALTRPNVPSARYSVVVALAPCAVALAVAGRFPRSGLWTVSGAVFVAVGGAVVVRQNWIEAGGYGRNHINADHKVRADVRAGMPVDLIARRHKYTIDPRFREYWRILWENNAGPIRGARPPAAYRTTEAAPPARISEPNPDPLVMTYRLLEGPDRFASAVRVRFRGAERTWQGVRFRWIVPTPEAGVQLREEVYSPWIPAGEGELLLWVNGPVRSMELHVANDTPPVVPFAVEILELDR